METQDTASKDHERICSGGWLAALICAITLLSLSMALFVAGAVCIIVRTIRQTDCSWPYLGSCVDVPRLKPAATALFIAGAVTGPLGAALLMLWIVAYCAARRAKKKHAEKELGETSQAPAAPAPLCNSKV